MGYISYLCERCIYKKFGSTAEDICANCDCGSCFVERSRYLKGENETMMYDKMYITTNNPYSNDFVKHRVEDMRSTQRWFVIKKVIFNAPATIVFWSDGTKTVVKCGENDEFDPEKGLAMAIAKRALGNQGNYYNEFKKWLPEKVEESDVQTFEFVCEGDALAEALKKFDPSKIDFSTLIFGRKDGKNK